MAARGHYCAGAHADQYHRLHRALEGWQGREEQEGQPVAVPFRADRPIAILTRASSGHREFSCRFRSSCQRTASTATTTMSHAISSGAGL